MEVISYSGYRADERPLRFRMNAVEREVLSVEDRWYGPDDEWFRVLADDQQLYVLRRSRTTGQWYVEAFRSR